MINKKCPKCRLKYSELENYCTKCGIELEKEENRCSANKTRYCRTRIFKDDDIYCSYCGSLTTYALERQQMNEENKS